MDFPHIHNSFMPLASIHFLPNPIPGNISLGYALPKEGTISLVYSSTWIWVCEGFDDAYFWVLAKAAEITMKNTFNDDNTSGTGKNDPIKLISTGELIFFILFYFSNVIFSHCTILSSSLLTMLCERCNKINLLSDDQPEKGGWNPTRPNGLL